MKKQLLYLFILCCIQQQSAVAQTTIEKDTVNSIFQKIVEDNISHITILSDFDSLLRGRRIKDYPKIKATIIFDNEVHQDTMKTKLVLRGRYRRKICDMPPIKLDFVKADLAEMGLDSTYDELKLVTHCLDEANSNQTLLKEYWTYRLYQELTPNSFKVHLVKITYLNENQPLESEERFAFLIENNKELADRIGGEMVSKFGLTPSKLDEKSYHYTLLFNYMIGNLDCNITHQRNIKYIQTEESLIVVPYDFDQSALVNAPYAKPHPDYQQKNLEDRYPIGNFNNKTALEAMVTEFIAKKNQLQIFNQCPYLAENEKLRMQYYIDSFFEQIEYKRQLRKAFLSNN